MQALDDILDNTRRLGKLVAISGSGAEISYAALGGQVAALRLLFRQFDGGALALALDNRPAWIALDIAAALERVTVVPVPHFFTAEQVAHLLRDSGACWWIGTQPPRDAAAGRRLQVFGDDLWLGSLASADDVPDTLPPGISRISYTSGTTGAPKGVMITRDQVDNVIASLRERVGACHNDRHLAAMPLSLLLENIAGAWTVLAAGGQLLLPSFTELGLHGSSRIEPERFLETLSRYRPTTLITVPALAELLVEGTLNDQLPDSLRHVAVGGAPVAPGLLDRAEEFGIPLYEGYGLTECGSVVAMNTLAERRRGSVGKPLPHVEVRIAGDGEILVRGSSAAGYVRDPEPAPVEWWPTGDLGALDDAGFLHVFGRKHNVYATAFGRNVSPEWIEKQLDAAPGVRESLVCGEGRHTNVAIIVRSPCSGEGAIAGSVESLNASLPDYARIGAYIITDRPFSTANRQRHPGGGLNREAIIRDHGVAIENHFANHETARSTNQLPVREIPHDIL